MKDNTEYLKASYKKAGVNGGITYYIGVVQVMRRSTVLYTLSMGIQRIAIEHAKDDARWYIDQLNPII